MRTVRQLCGADRQAALEAMSKAVAARVAKACLGTSESARVTAEAMLEGVAVLDGVTGPVVLLRASFSDAELAYELEALAANYRQRHLEHEAAEAEWHQRYVNNENSQSPALKQDSCEPEQTPGHDNPKSLSHGQTPIVPPSQVDEND
ncbi:hypothetical protein [Halomonas citrativorans]|uniref:Uncharacterized protein n=1 Tax=Halomonas citrativorans TaxID=2742612 RepID=A0ABR9F9C9_9GAMM|nr:hypothetical protein [Halomonas citrativorans]MBE0403088.1 hypothetical protein [Halomonas citrativorans]